MSSADLLAAARRIADEELFPRALETDERGSVPLEELECLREAGLYGIFSPTEVGGSAVDMPTRYLIQEALAGGCLTTAFVWQQHAGAAAAAAATHGPMRSRASAMAAGEVRGGVAFAHLVRPGPPILTATPDEGGWRFNGVAPFVTGWGHIDLVLTAARHEDRIVWALLDAHDAPTLVSRRLELAAIDSSDTYGLRFEDHPVSGTDVTSIVDFAGWFAGYQMGLRANGSLALGVTARCLRLLGPSALDHELDAARELLDTVPHEEMPTARGNIGALGVRAAGALIASIGGAAMFRSHHAQRLAREALFLLVQGQTPEIKEIHRSRLGA